MIASTKPGVIFPETPDEDIPSALIHDIMDGRPYCYKCGDGTLQRIIINNYVLRTLFEKLLNEHSLFLAIGTGLYINDRNVLTSDISIFKRSDLVINEHYTQVPPKIVLDFDVKVDLGDISEDEYIVLKATKLIAFGVDEVFYILPRCEKVVVVNKYCWSSFAWDSEISVLPGISLNIGRHLRDERASAGSNL